MAEQNSEKERDSSWTRYAFASWDKGEQSDVLDDFKSHMKRVQERKHGSFGQRLLHMTGLSRRVEMVEEGILIRLRTVPQERAVAAAEPQEHPLARRLGSGDLGYRVAHHGQSPA